MRRSAARAALADVAYVAQWLREDLWDRRVESYGHKTLRWVAESGHNRTPFRQVASAPDLPSLGAALRAATTSTATEA